MSEKNKFTKSVNIIRQKLSSLDNFYKDLGISTYLCTKSTYHQSFTSGHILAYIMPSLRLNQYKIYYKAMNPMALVSWAFLSDDVSAKYEKGDYVLKMNEFNEGNNVWITEFVVADDDAKMREEIIEDLKQGLFIDKEVKVLVRNSDGSVKRIFTSVGNKYNKVNHNN